MASAVRSLGAVLLCVAACRVRSEQPPSRMPSPAVRSAPSSLPAGAELPSSAPARPRLDPALAADARRLIALRAVPPGHDPSCEQFRELDLEARLSRLGGQDHGMNGCGSGAAAVVKCVETRSGFFVPVDTAAEFCSYRLWYVPRDGEQWPLPVSAVLEEFDLAYTVRIAAADLDADGTEEALLIRGWSHPEGIGEGQEAYLVEPTGEHVPLPFEDMDDVDHDGLLDAFVTFSQTVNATGCEPAEAFEAWVPRDLSAPRLMLHGLRGGKFSLTDEAARAARAKRCQNLGQEVIARRAGRAVDEEETMRRAVCRMADGEDPAAIVGAIGKACSRDYAMPEDCKKMRSGVCFWRSSLLALPERFAALEPWLAGG